MRKIFLLICFFMPIACGAHSMHIGDEEIPFHSTQYTRPSMHVQIGNEIVHAPAVKKDIRNTLHVLYNNSVYSICRGTERKVGNHYFVGDCLVAADDNVYLESTGEQYIDTGIQKNNGITFNMTINFLSCPNSYCMNGLLNDVQIGISRSGMWHTFSNGFYGDTIFAEYNKWYETELICNNNKCDLYANGDFISSESFGNNNDGFAIAAANRYDENKGAFFAYERIKYFSAVDNGVFIRKMIPVPAGLQIGNFTVPENGMWDIVEQKFYGNSGTGEFIYGVD